MADYSDNALLASIKALEQVVLPAIDPADPLAGEQLRLVTGFLKFFRTRMPYSQARQLFELDHYLRMGLELSSDARQVSPEVSLRLDSAIEHAQALQRDACGDVAQIQQATRELSSALSGLARAAGSADASLRRRVEQTILAGSRRWVDMQRTWFAPQGFELHKDELPGLQEALVSPRPTA